MFPFSGVSSPVPCRENETVESETWGEREWGRVAFGQQRRVRECGATCLPQDLLQKAAIRVWHLNPLCIRHDFSFWKVRASFEFRAGRKDCLPKKGVLNDSTGIPLIVKADKFVARIRSISGTVLSEFNARSCAYLVKSCSSALAPPHSPLFRGKLSIPVTPCTSSHKDFVLQSFQNFCHAHHVMVT